jgi:hypothetical protein
MCTLWPECHLVSRSLTCDCTKAGYLRPIHCLRSSGGNVFRGTARATGTRCRCLAGERRRPRGERPPGQRRRARPQLPWHALPASRPWVPWWTRWRRARRALRRTGFPRPRLRGTRRRHAHGRARRPAGRAVARRTAGRFAAPGTTARRLPRRSAARTGVRPAPVRTAPGTGGPRSGWPWPQVPRRSGAGIRYPALQRRLPGPGPWRFPRPRLRSGPRRSAGSGLFRAGRSPGRTPARPVLRPNWAGTGFPRRPLPRRPGAGGSVHPWPAGAPARTDAARLLRSG